jgi:hypothetical protein
MMVSAKDAEILKSLGGKIAQISKLPIHTEKEKLWKDLNSLKKTRPLVWINEIPWHEMNINDELTLQCEDAFCRQLENHLRMTLYQWNHLPADMIVNGYIGSPLAIHDTCFGIEEEVDIVQTDEASTVVSRHFHRQIKNPEDIEKIKMPVVMHDVNETEKRFSGLREIYRNILPVRKEGIKTIWFTPWDNLIRWWGVEEAMIDLVERPEMVHAMVERIVDSCLCGLDQLEKLNLLSMGNDAIRVGSGGYGCTDELPGPDYDPNHIRPCNLWGCSNAQIFSEVSPEMHWEFAIKHDLRWLERWGLNYYGCCEPLDGKISILRKIPRLRKISMSPWINLERAVREVGRDFVFSFKPNPAILAEDAWRPHQVRKDLERVLEITRGCVVEIILKDISTVRYQPTRLWEWSNIAMELVLQRE